MQDKAPESYAAVLAGEEESRRRFSGHGSAMAQVYNHMIMPIANSRDKRTQVRWGIADFEHRFGRKPDGMWLAETAVDIESLELLAEHGLTFTVLAPGQAGRVRRIGGRAWKDVSGGRIDPTRAYLQRLPSGRAINLFFYDGPISQGVAFEELLRSGEAFTNRLETGFDDERTWPELVHIATDGETYGHHHRHGEMAFAYALDHIESSGIAQLTNYGEYLERHPANHQVEIIEDTSWSCIHGIERWRANCGCNSGGNNGWTQEWRAPLLESLCWLRDELAPRYESHARQLLRDPWAARDAYADVILNREPERVEAFLREHAAHELSEGERTRALKLLELQRHAMLMFTSCGWFFDELSGIETVQVIQYAGRALQLAEELFGEPLEARFLGLLEQAKSNIPEHQDGREIFRKFVKPAVVSLEKVGAHFAVSSLFEAYGDTAQVYCYTIDREDYRLLPSGKARLAVGRANVTSNVTQESRRVTFGVLHLGDHNLTGGVRGFQSDEAYDHLADEITAAFSRADLPELLRIVDRDFGSERYSLKLLFRDEQRKILDIILDSTLAEAEAVYGQLYEHHAPLMRFLADLAIPLPRGFQTAAEFALNTSLSQAMRSDDLDPPRIEGLLGEAKLAGVNIDGASLGFQLGQTVERLAREFRQDGRDLSAIQRLETAVGLAQSLPFDVDLWKVQNIYWETMQSLYPEVAARAQLDGDEARAWVEHFTSIGEKLGVSMAQANEA
jgi:hypothetical protein